MASHSEDTDFRHQFFTIPGAGVSSDSEQHQLAAVLWSQGQNLPGSIPRPLVLYLHTNTRCLLDAKEVLPVCDELGASLLAFDLPGCGHSEGTLTFQMTQVGSCASCRYIIHNFSYLNHLAILNYLGCIFLLDYRFIGLEKSYRICPQ